MRDIEIGRRGRLYSHTIQAFIDLDEGPRIFSLIGAECPVEDGVLDDGMEMQLVIEPLADTPENKEILSYKYVPAKAHGDA
jgi:hypothetical protein